MTTRRRGFTIIELLGILAILSIIGAALLTLSLIGGRSYLGSEASSHVHGQARQALDAMAHELRQGGNTVTTAANQCAFQMDVGYNLALATASCPNAICWGALDQNGVPQAGWSVRYRLNGAQLLREILDPGAVVQPGTRVLANDVNQLTFTYAAGTRTMTVQLQVRYDSAQLAGGSLSTAALLTRAKLRNP